MKKLIEFTAAEMIAYHLFKKRHGHFPKSDKELKFAVMEQRTYLDLIICASLHNVPVDAVTWSEEQSRFVVIGCD